MRRRFDGGSAIVPIAQLFCTQCKQELLSLNGYGHVRRHSDDMLMTLSYSSASESQQLQIPLGTILCEAINHILEGHVPRAGMSQTF